MKQRRQKTTKSLILALAVAVAAIAVPTAQARLDSERTQVPQTPANMYSPQAFEALIQRSVALNEKYGQAEAQSAYAPALRALRIRSEAMNAWYRQHSSTPVIPDAFSRELTKVQSVASAVRHADDRAGVRGPGTVQTSQVVSSSGIGFDWGDASLGAGIALGIALILGSGLVLVRRSQGGHQVPA